MLLPFCRRCASSQHLSSELLILPDNQFRLSGSKLEISFERWWRCFDKLDKLA